MFRYISFFLSILGCLNAGAQNCLSSAPCPAATLDFCDTTQNNPDFWNNSLWWDTPNMSSDNAEHQVSASFTFTQTCGGALTIYYQLYLDLDHDNLPETLVDSRDLPEAGSVHYGNLLAGPTILPFDTRAVAPEDIFQFALETVQNGNEHTARLRWNTPGSPQTYVDPELPNGQHYIRWVAEEAGGEQIECSYNLKVRDCKAPTIVCINGLSINIMPTQMVTMWSSDFLQYTEDNTSPTAAIATAIRKAGQGTGFPQDNEGNPQVSLTFFCTELGPIPVELWARDAAGNVGVCNTTVIVEDPIGNCGPVNALDLTLCARQWCSGAPIGYVEGVLNNDSPTLPELTLPGEGPDASGCLAYASPLILGANYTFTPQLGSDPLNGVNALDMARISQHILATNPLEPFAQIAADVNKSNTITGADIITLRNLLLGQTLEFPNAPSWRFIDAGTTFSNPLNAFADAPFAESKTFSPMSDVSFTYDFTGIKVGDVDCSASPGLNGQPAEERSPVAIALPDVFLNAGEEVNLALTVSDRQEWLALQLALQFTPELVAVEIIEADNLPNPENLAFAQPDAGRLNTVWFSPTEAAVKSGEVILQLRIRAFAPVWLHDALRLAPEGLSSTAFDVAGERHPFVLLFSRNEGEPMAVGAAFPNPGSGDVNLPVYCTETALAQLQVVDIRGTVIFNLRQELPGGASSLTIPAAVFGPAGLYGWQMNVGGQVWTGKLVRN